MHVVDARSDNAEQSAMKGGLAGMQRRVGALLLSLCLAATVACAERAQPIERGRLASPDGRVDAVLVEWPSNALSDPAFGMVLVAHSESLPATIQTQVSCPSLSLAGMRWLDALTIQVQYPKGATIYSFHNHWNAPPAAGEDLHEIEVLLVRQ